jgi:mRNA interferase MazF
LKRGELWWADLGPFRPREQTGARPVVLWQSDTLTAVLDSVLVIPLTTNLSRARLAGSALVEAGPDGPTETSVALAFQLRAVPKSCLKRRIRALSEAETLELELATDEALGRAEPR